MTLKLSASQHLSVARTSNFSFKASGIESGLSETWFILGFKRTTGAPATVSDLVEKWNVRFFDCERGSYTYGATGSISAVQEGLNGAGTYPLAEAGDHMYLLVSSGTPDQPDASATFDAVLPLGSLRA